MSLSLIRLGAEWAESIRSLRHDSLVESPHVFLRDFAEERDLPASHYAKWCDGIVIGAVTEERMLVGMATLYVMAGLRVAHRAHLGAVYLTPEYRGQGHSRRLLEHALREVRPPVTQIHLAVGENNPAAIRLYASLGFETYGTDPRAICYDGENFVDDRLMVKYLAHDGSERPS